ncbi:MAG: restriction endonuclease subunit S [Cyanobacteria bacterium P01_H01_bin.21]
MTLDSKIELYEIPDSWQWIKLQDISYVISGEAFKKREYSTSGIKLLQIANVSFGQVIWGKQNFLPEVFLEKYPELVLQEGDIVMALNRPILNDVLKIAQLNLDDAPAILYQRVGCFKFYQKNISEYFFRYVKSAFFMNQVALNLKGSDQPYINTSTLPKFRFPLPPLNEQHRIVTKIEALTTRSRKARAALAAIPPLLDQFRDSVLAAAFRGDLTADWRAQNPDVEPAETLLERIRAERQARWEVAELEKMEAKGKVPKNDRWKEKYKEPLEIEQLPFLVTWCQSTVIDSCKLVVDCHNKTAPYKESGIKLVRTSNIRNGSLSLDNVKYIDQPTYEYWSRRCKPSSGDILFTREAPMAEVAMIPEGEKICMGQRMMLLRVDQKNLLGEYLLFMLQTPFVREYVEKTAVGTGVKHLRVRDVEGVPVRIAPIQEQKEICKKLRELFDLIESLRQLYHSNFEDLSTLDQSILTKAFQGQLVLQDPNDEPASVLLERIRTEREKFEKKGKGRKGKGKRLKSGE